jgi:serine protease Do
MVIRPKELCRAAIVCGFMLQVGPVGYLHAATEPAHSPPAGSEAKKSSTSHPSWVWSAPKPARVDSKDLSEVFQKEAPTSLADLKAIEERVKRLVSRVSPAVVAVEVGFSSGSGVIITEDGLVLTAGHVCGAPNRDVRFTFPDGTTARGKTLGLDQDSDTGLMKITSPGYWPHVGTGELDETETGTWVLALGHPGGYDRQRSLVVRLGRIIRLAPGVVQTDCTISPGDSGGPLFDMYGRVIGIHSAISASVAENFHVPITDFYSSWNQLVEVEAQQARLGKAYFGATVADERTGCRLSAVDHTGPASQAGLKAGDLILKVDGREIRVAASFRRWVSEARPGETLSLEIKRDGKLLSMNVKLQAQPAES